MKRSYVTLAQIEALITLINESGVSELIINSLHHLVITHYTNFKNTWLKLTSINRFILIVDNSKQVWWLECINQRRRTWTFTCSEITILIWEFSEASNESFSSLIRTSTLLYWFGVLILIFDNNWVFLRVNYLFSVI